MGKREGNRPDRRIAPPGAVPQLTLQVLARSLRYVGSGHHKLTPGDYGFQPATNPRPTKSVCDDLRPVGLVEAEALLARGIKLGMVSTFAAGGAPKYVWAVDEFDEVYEIKIGSERDYHGYRLGDDEHRMRNYVLKEWRGRCRTD